MRRSSLTVLWTIAILLPAAAYCQENSPFFPSSQTTPDGKTVGLDAFARNADCMRCHERIGKQWQGSMHAAALNDPVFQALYKLGSEQTNGLTDKLCAGCHSSPAVVSGHSAPKDVFALGKPASEGVSCVVCHSVSGPNEKAVGADPQNASFIIDPAGPINGAHALRPCGAGRKTVKNSFLSKSEFCATCHGVVHPLNGFVVERTYEEWRSSIYAAKGIQCQDCHMQPVEKAIETALTLKRVPNPGRVAENGPPRSHHYSHDFIGGNAVVTKLLGSNGHSAMAEKLLKSAASINISVADSDASSRTVQLRVQVNNETAGHNLPTSLIEVRQMWLDVEVTDGDGKVLLSSGKVADTGAIDPDAVMFHGVAVDENGKPTVLPWEMTRFTYFHTIPPKGHTVERYAFAYPTKNKGPYKVKATLRYRSFPQAVANLLLGENAPTIPIIDMTTAESTVTIKKGKAVAE